MEHDADLHGLEEYAAFGVQLAADSVIGPQLNKLVGTRMGSFRVDVEQLAARLAAESISDGVLTFDEVRFARAYERLEGELYAKTVPFVAIGPLAGLAQAPTIRFGLMELDRLGDEEAQLLLDTGYLQSSDFGTGPWVHTNTEYVLRLAYDLPKLVGSLREGEDPFQGVPNARELFFEVVVAMRILKSEPVAVPGIVTRSPVGGGSSRSWGSTGSPPPRGLPSYRLSEDEARDLVAIWAALGAPDVQRRAFIGTAARRLAYATERARVEDSFVDLMIAAEALFLGEKRKGETAGELTYKISMRFAHFVNLPGTSLRQRYEHMKRAYGARSAIVHGDRPRGLKAPEELARLTGETADYLRWALRSMIDEAQRHPERQTLVDWDEVILGAQQ